MSTEENLICWGDSFVGKIGFSFTARSIQALASALHKYKLANLVDKICIGYDNRNLAKEFSEELVNCLSMLEVGTVIPDDSIPIPILSWLQTQSDRGKKTIGVYIGGGSSQIGFLTISFKNEDGSPFTPNQTAELHSQYLYFLLGKAPPITGRALRSDYIDIREGYGEWVLDRVDLKKFPLTSEGSFKLKVQIDAVTSPIFPYLDPIFKNLNIGMRQIPKDFYDRLIINGQLRPNPNSWLLPYAHTKEALVGSPEKICISFDGDGDTIGVYDGAVKAALTPAGVFSILLYYIAKIKRKKGTVLIDTAVSEKVSVLAKSYGLAVEYIDNGLYGLTEVLKEKRKRPPLMYGDSEGGFWFKGFPPDRIPFVALLYLLDACWQAKITPANLYDKVIEGILDREYVYTKADLDPTHLNFTAIDLLLNSLGSIGTYKILKRIPPKHKKQLGNQFFFTAGVLTLEQDSRIVLQSNPKTGFVEVCIESPTTQTTKELLNEIQKTIFIDDLSSLV